MELSSNIVLSVLAQETMEEMHITSSTCTEQDFDMIVKTVHKKINIDLKQKEMEVTEEETKEDDDQLRSFLLGKRNKKPY